MALANANLIPEAKGWRLLRPASYKGAVLLGPRTDEAVATTEDDAAGSIADRSISLLEHSADVVAKAEAFVHSFPMMILPSQPTRLVRNGWTSNSVSRIGRRFLSA